MCQIKYLSSAIELSKINGATLVSKYIENFLANQLVNFIQRDGVYPEDYTGNLLDCVRETHDKGFCYYESDDSIDLVEFSENHYVNYNFTVACSYDGCLKDLSNITIKFTRINYACGGEDFDMLSHLNVKLALKEFMNDFECDTISLIE